MKEEEFLTNLNRLKDAMIQNRQIELRRIQFYFFVRKITMN